MEENMAASYVIDVLSTIVAMEYMDHGFEKKYSGAARIKLFAGGCLVYYGVMVLLNRHIAFEGLLGISYAGVLAAYGLIALKGKAQKVIIHSLLWVLVAISSSHLVYGALGIITGGARLYFPCWQHVPLNFPWAGRPWRCTGGKRSWDRQRTGCWQGHFSACLF